MESSEVQTIQRVKKQRTPAQMEAFRKAQEARKQKLQQKKQAPETSDEDLSKMLEEHNQMMKQFLSQASTPQPAPKKKVNISEVIDDVIEEEEEEEDLEYEDYPRPLLKRQNANYYQPQYEPPQYYQPQQQYQPPPQYYQPQQQYQQPPPRDYYLSTQYSSQIPYQYNDIQQEEAPRRIQRVNQRAPTIKNYGNSNKGFKTYDEEDEHHETEEDNLMSRFMR